MLTEIDSIPSTNPSLVQRTLSGLDIIKKRSKTDHPVQDVSCPRCDSFEVAYTGFCKSRGKVFDEYHCTKCHFDFIGGEEQK